MAETNTEYISYPNPSFSEGLVIEPIQGGRVTDVAVHVETVLLRAFQRAFEEKNKLVPPRSVEQYLFNPHDTRRVALRVERISSSIERGSSYSLAWANNVDTEAVGVIKTTPSRPRGILGPTNCYVNDVMTTEDGRGIGSTLLYAGIAGYKADRVVVLDAFVGNTRTNEWFEGLGFGLKGTSEENTFNVGPHGVKEIRYEHPVVSGLRTVLTTRNPWLLEAREV